MLKLAEMKNCSLKLVVDFLKSTNFTYFSRRFVDSYCLVFSLFCFGMLKAAKQTFKNIRVTLTLMMLNVRSLD